MTHPLVATARRALGVPYRHQGRSLEGLDCLGLVVWSLRELGLEPPDETNYARWPDASRLTRGLGENCLRVSLDELREGDILRMSFAGEPIHLGIASDHGLIHSAQMFGAVVEHRLDSKWRRRLVDAWRIEALNNG